MKLRIFTGMLLVMFLSVFNSFQAQAHDGCKKDKCCSKYRHTGCWGHHGYYYGPDGAYAKNKGACCDKKEGSSCSDKKDCCKSKCARSWKGTYTRARYHEDCCGRGHLTSDNNNDD